MSYISRFPDNDACWAQREAMRWRDGLACPKCGRIDQAAVQKSRPHYWQWRALFTVAMGTPLEGTGRGATWSVAAGKRGSLGAVGIAELGFQSIRGTNSRRE